MMMIANTRDDVMDWTSKHGLEGLKGISELLNQCGDAVFVKDDKDRIVLANDRFVDEFASNCDPLGCKSEEFLPNDMKQVSADTDELVRQTGKMACFTYSTNSGSGESKRFCTIKVPLLSSNGERIATVCASFSERGDRKFDNVPNAQTLLEARKVASRFSWKQRRVVDAICEGLMNKEIALKLGMSLRSVESYRSKSVKDFGLDSVAELVRMVAMLENNGISIRIPESEMTQSHDETEDRA